ncbi:MAG: YSC84-related protein [Phycisphaerales bacterium]
MNARKLRVVALASVAGAALITPMLAGCSAGYKTDSEKQSMQSDVDRAVSEFKREDPSLANWFRESYGYAIFPTVGKGAVGVGGAHGKGLVYEQGVPIGNATLSQATIGLALGGQAYREVIFFQNKAALDNFTGGHFEFAAQASAVAVTAGASADADFENGMAVFTMEEGGLMFEASIGGQKFSFNRW